MLLSRLRTETRAAHLRIERELDLMSDELTLARYGMVLSRFHAFIAAWEPIVAARIADEAFLAPRRKLPLLAADLARLGIPASANRPLRMPRLEDVPTAMGSLYVMEGATLGGQVILRHVGERLGLGPGDGTSFFASYGHDVGRYWQTFRARLEAGTPAARHDAVVAGALATFACLTLALSDPRVPPARRGAEAAHV